MGKNRDRRLSLPPHMAEQLAEASRVLPEFAAFGQAQRILGDLDALDRQLDRALATLEESDESREELSTFQARVKGSRLEVARAQARLLHKLVTDHAPRLIENLDSFRAFVAKVLEPTAPKFLR